MQGGKTEGLGKFLTLLTNNVPAEKAFGDAFRMTYAQMEKELKKYVEQNTYKYSLVSFKNKLIFDSEMQSTPMSEAASNTYLGDLLYHTNRADDAEPYLQKAVALEPASSMANTTLGMVKMHQRKYDEAKKYLEKAVFGGQNNHLALYRYAYLLSRENRDEFGYVASFPAEKSAKMRELLKKAIAINPSFTESYELLAFVNLVNNEQLDEAVGYLQKALKYQPGNQTYAVRIAEIYLRQQKFAEAALIAEKIAKTADEPELKAQAENLTGQIRQIKEALARNESARKQFEAAINEANKSGGQPILIQRDSNGKTLSPEESAKKEEEATLRSINQALRKPQTGEKQIVGQIQKIECKDKITYSVKTASETFTLASKDFENLQSNTFVAGTEGVQIGCGVNIAGFNAALTYKPQTDVKTGVRGELTAIDFVPKNFRIMSADELKDESETLHVAEQPPPPLKTEDFEARRREAMTQSIKSALRQPLTGEKRELGFIEKVECGSKGMFFFIKNQTQIFKLAAATPQAIQVRAFTPDIEQLQIGCAMKQVDIPVIFTFKENSDSKAKSNGDLIALEFVPKSFVLEK